MAAPVCVPINSALGTALFSFHLEKIHLRVAFLAVILTCFFSSYVWGFNFQVIIYENPIPHHLCSPFLINVLESLFIQYHRLLIWNQILIWISGLLFHGDFRNRASPGTEPTVPCSKLSAFSCLPGFRDQCLFSA